MAIDNFYIYNKIMEPDLIPTSNPVFKKATSSPSPWEKFLSIFKINRGINSSATQMLDEVIHNQKINKQEIKQKIHEQDNIKKSIEKEVDIIKLENISKLDYEKIVKIRIPEIFEDYLGISDEYKTKLKTIDNKTPDDLLYDSLNEVYQIVSQIHEQQQNDKLNSMSIKNKYLKSKNI